MHTIVSREPIRIHWNGVHSSNIQLTVGLNEVKWNALPIKTGVPRIHFRAIDIVIYYNYINDFPKASITYADDTWWYKYN